MRWRQGRPRGCDSTICLTRIRSPISLPLNTGYGLSEVRFCQRRNQLETSTSVEIAKHTLMTGGLVLAVGTVTSFVAQKIKIPDVAVFLVVGMLIGPQMLGLIDIKADSALNQILLLFGASYILFDGGASLRFNVLRRVWITILVIATVGVLITAAITAGAAYVILGVPWIVALLLGATL